MTDADEPDQEITAAFEALRREICLTRSAVEGLTAARERLPDYSVTLAKMNETLAAQRSAIERLATSPAIQLSPAALSQEITKAAQTTRAEDARRLEAADQAMHQAIGWIDGIVKRGQAADRQKRRLVWAAITGVLAGVLLWAVLPGAIARRLPERWHVPEWMAARTMGMNEKAAGRRLVTVAKLDAKQGVE